MHKNLLRGMGGLGVHAEGAIGQQTSRWYRNFNGWAAKLDCKILTYYVTQEAQEQRYECVNYRTTGHANARNRSSTYDPLRFSPTVTLSLWVSRVARDRTAALTFSELLMRGLTAPGTQTYAAPTHCSCTGALSDMPWSLKQIPSEAWQLPVPENEETKIKAEPRMPPLDCPAWQARARMTRTRALPNRIAPYHCCLT